MPLSDCAGLTENPQVQEVLRDPEVAELLKDSPRAGGKLVRLIQQFEFSGPLPPAAELARYEKVVPGSAARIVKWAEEEGEHRRAMERLVIPSNIRNASRGQMFAFILALAAIAAGTAIVLTGHSATGLAVIIADLATLAGVFVLGRIRAGRQI